ncbi:MAG: hypothetical protein OXN17_19660 [Candidatus Poribacteria bacterium]|nr:hypothetical protein [Candidatus Poribacteria bacterium]
MLKPLPNIYLIVPALVYLLLLFGCGADEIGNTPLGENGATDVAPAPVSSPYYPIALGNRWTYRNPDGSEWSREVAKLEILESERYHSFRYSEVKKASPHAMEDNIPRWLRPIEYDFHDLVDSIGPAEYITYAESLVRTIPPKDFNDAIRKIVLDSGGETPQWNMEIECNIDPDVPRLCNMVTDDSLFNPPGILNMLFYTKPHVASLGKFTALRFPLLPNQSYTTLDFRLRSKSVVLNLWEFYADSIIVATIGNAPELVETPTGSFQDCLKVQYEAGPILISTLQFVEVGPLAGIGELTPEELKAFELTLHDELTALLAHLMPKLGLQTMWLAPGVGPVKIETPNGIAELIDYDIKPVE